MGGLLRGEADAHQPLSLCQAFGSLLLVHIHLHARLPQVGSLELNQKYYYIHGNSKIHKNLNEKKNNDFE